MEKNLETQERVRDSHGKRAIAVRAIKFQCHCLKSVERRGYTTLSFCNKQKLKTFEGLKGCTFSCSKWHIHSLIYLKH